MQLYDQLGNLVGTQSLPIDSTLHFSHPAIDDGKPLLIRSGANSINWSYRLNTQATPTIGGEVIQILSCYVGPITIQGLASGMSTKVQDNLKQPAGWGPGAFTPADEMSQIVLWFTKYMHRAGGGRKRRIEEAIKFTYPARGWEFYIQVTNIKGFDLRRDQVAVPWAITAEVVDDPGLDYFISETMSQYTDSLTSRAALQVAISKDFEFAANPFINPALDVQTSSANLASRLGDNFQALVAAWSYGDFNVLNTGFSSIADPKRQTGVDNPYDYYTQIVGGTYLGDPTKIRSDYNASFFAEGGSPIGGSEVINADPSAALYGDKLKSYLVCKSRALNLDPAAILADVEAEGGWNGTVGDNGTSFGPFQLHIGGKLPSQIAAQGKEKAREWANSVEGVNYALESIAKSAAGLTGKAAMDAIVEWENPTGDHSAISAQRASRISYWEKYAATVNCSGNEPLIGGTLPNLGPVWVGGQSVLLQSLTHATDKLPLYPAFDDAFHRPGEAVLAPENLTIERQGSAQGGAAFYATGNSGLRYWFGHVERSPSVGAKFSKGQVMAKIASEETLAGVTIPHVHVGINVEALFGPGKELIHRTDYKTGAPLVGQQLAKFFGVKFG